MFVIKNVDERVLINKNQRIGLGTVKLGWKNSYGDVGRIVYGPLITLEDSDSKC